MRIFMTISVFVLSALVGWLFFAQYGQSERMAYINLEMVYNDFVLKKELEEKINKVQLTRQSILDSLKIRVQLLSKQVEDKGGRDLHALERLQYLREEFFAKERQFAEDNQAATQEYNKQILQQLNQYVQDFGKENQYRFIFGANGEGSIMYAQDLFNITEEVKKYVNEKYAGRSK